MINDTLLRILFAFVVFASFGPTKETLAQDAEKCIQPYADFSYPVNEPYARQDKLPEVFPSSPWVVEADAPANMAAFAVELVEAREGYAVVWGRQTEEIASPDGLNYYYPNEQVVFWRYRTDRKVWHKVQGSETLLTLNQEQTVRLLKMADGAIWRVLGNNFERYSEAGDRFETVWAAPVGAADPVSALQTDAQNTFWFIWNDRLYRFDPHTGQPQMLYDPGGALSDLALAPNGDVFLLRKDTKQLIYFSPQKQQARTLEVDFSTVSLAPAFMDDRYPSELFMDHLGRLWVHDYGWLEPGNDAMRAEYLWYQMMPAAVFVSANVQGARSYVKETPSILLESADGLLWFRSSNGLTWLDPQQGKWCWFTTVDTAVVEDGRHNLWLTAGAKLFWHAAR